MSGEQKHNTIVCGHCGKEYDEAFSYCPYCAEPKPEPRPQEPELTPEETIRYYDARETGLSILLFVIAILPSILLADVVWFVVNLLTPPNGRDMYEQANDLLPNHNITVPVGLAIAIGVSLLYDFYQTRKSTRKKLISIQYEKDSRSICPKCGCHDIALGRKGYDWKKAYRYRNVKGGQYYAGMDSRRVTARCRKCGHKWETEYKWTQ